MFMRVAVLALVSACALAACNPSTPSGGGEQGASSSGAGLFPSLFQTAYRAEAVVTDESGATTPMVMIRDGRKLRMEMAGPQGQMTIITNGDTGESYMITTAGGRTMAMRTTLDQQDLPSANWEDELAETATRTGSCSAAGQSGGEWTSQEGGVVSTACITDDGIILRATEGDRVVWETTRVQRGPQNPALFALPAGVQVMDLGQLGVGQ
jgi:hypothetical protein